MSFDFSSVGWKFSGVVVLNFWFPKGGKLDIHEAMICYRRWLYFFKERTSTGLDDLQQC